MLGRPQLHELYHLLKLNRRLEEELGRLALQGKIPGGVHLSTGQEAVSVGSAFALRPGDYLAPAIRNIGSLLARGVTPFEILAHFMGKAAGPTRGRCGVLQLGDLKRQLVAPISHLGTQVSVMAGVALGARMLGKPAVGLTYVGDGALATGDFHEGINFAAVHRLPLVVVIENNQFAFSTPSSMALGSNDLSRRAEGYGIPGIAVDGNDVLRVHHVTETAIERARRGEGATLIEARTLRMAGHALHDDQTYVPSELLAEWKAKDPILRFELFLTEGRLLDASDRERIGERVENVIREALRRAERERLPEPSSGSGGVYADRAAPPPPASAVRAG
jgi:pyruvate dehydrogenase E1 component alpha subunit/2-oxoisovalerate dehydrogenase E1 component alpha subunit